APGHLVDINHLPSLATIEVSGEGVRIGALARHRQVELDASAYDAVPLLRQALENVAHPTIRNRGTTVGSLVHADPAAEMTAVLALLGGNVELVGPGGTRQVAADDFFTGPMSSATAEDELAVSAVFPQPAAGSGTAFVELARRHGDYAMCGVAAVVTLDGDLDVTAAKVGLICVGDGPVVVDLGSAVSGGSLDPGVMGELVDAAIEPEADIHATAEYRRHLALVLTGRAVDQARDNALARSGAAANSESSEGAA
ncbi:MAG: FAD binding domain-containing protein, partial [Nocardioides sp.]